MNRISFLILIGLFTLFISAIMVSADTEVKGILTGNQIWTKENSPYIINSNILIEEGSMLTIQSGVEVIVNGDYYILIKGALNATGKPNDLIHFHSKDEGGGSWYGIYFANKEKSALDYTKIEYGGKMNSNENAAIFCGRESNSTILITNSLIINNWVSIGLRGCKDIQIVNNEISKSNIGIYSQFNSSPLIEKNSIVTNGIGIYSYGSIGLIANNVISSNQIGINVYNNMPCCRILPKIYLNDISTNNLNLKIEGDQKDSVNATYNYWGYTTTEQITRKNWDFLNDFRIGKINFEPFLKEFPTTLDKSNEYEKKIMGCNEYQIIVSHKCIECKSDEIAENNTCFKLRCAENEEVSNHICKKLSCGIWKTPVNNKCKNKIMEFFRKLF